MFILGDADLRTPPTQGGEAMFRALKYLHKTTVQVRFPASRTSCRAPASRSTG